MRKKQSICILLALLICAVLAMCAALLVRRQYAEKLIAQTWPAGMASPAVTMQAATPGKKTLLLLGDSRAAQWGLPQIKDHRVINGGVPGMTSAQLVLRHREILDRVQPQAAVVQIGINDLKLLGVRPELREAVVSGCVSNIQTVVQECQRRGVRVVITPVWPAWNLTLARRFVWNKTVGEAVEETNGRLERLFANQAGVRVADIFSTVSRQHPGGRGQLYHDTLHLKPETYDRLSTLLSETINAWTNELGGAAQTAPGNKPVPLPNQ